MQDPSPKDMRREAKELLKTADTASSSDERNSLASKAFALAQKAEATERAARGEKQSPSN
jgi:hypothetical protein